MQFHTKKLRQGGRRSGYVVLVVRWFCAGQLLLGATAINWQE